MVRLSFLSLLSLLKVDADDVGADADASLLLEKEADAAIREEKEGEVNMFFYSVLYIYVIENNSFRLCKFY